MKRSILILGILLLSQFAFTQYQMGLIPRSSPDKGDFQKIGFTEIEIKYGSPSVRDREIWGDLVPYDKVWRAGANNATTIEFSTDVIVGDQKLEKGKYAFFILPQENKKWIAIFNKEHAQWGAFKYSKETDALRIEVLPSFGNQHTEELEYAISSSGFQFGSLNLAWGSLNLCIDFDTDYVQQFSNEIEARIAKADKNLHWVIYLQGAEHLERINTKLDLAMQWIEKSETLSQQVTDWNKQFYPKSYVEGHVYWTKAKILVQQEDFEGALEYAAKMKADGESAYYKRKNEAEEIDRKIIEWEIKRTLKAGW